MAIAIEDLGPGHDGELADFLDRLGRRSASVLGYHYPFYRDLIAAAGAGRPHYLGARVGGELAGVLPAFALQSESGTVYSSLPFFGPNAGVLAAADGQAGDVQAALLSALLDRARAADALGCSVYTPFLDEDFQAYDAVMPAAQIVEKFTQYLDLETTAWSSAIAYDLRKGKRLGVQISKEVSAERVDQFYELYHMNCVEYDIPIKPKPCVERLFRENHLGKHSDAYFALRDNEMIGGLLMVWSPLTASYYIPCTLPSARTLQPGTLLIDRAVQDARQRGIRYWNWEASPSRESGVFQFKKKWGSTEGRYRIYIQAFKPAAVFRGLGRATIERDFPFYFVYPFDRL